MLKFRFSENFDNDFLKSAFLPGFGRVSVAFCAGFRLCFSCPFWLYNLPVLGVSRGRSVFSLPCVFGWSVWAFLAFGLLLSLLILCPFSLFGFSPFPAVALYRFRRWDQLPVLILFGFHRLPVWGGAVAFLEGFTRSGFASFGLFAF